MTHAVNKLLAVTQDMNHEVPMEMGLLGFAPGVAIGLFEAGCNGQFRIADSL